MQITFKIIGHESQILGEVMAPTKDEALERARRAYPDKVFRVQGENRQAPKFGRKVKPAKKPMQVPLAKAA